MKLLNTKQFLLALCLLLSIHFVSCSDSPDEPAYEDYTGPVEVGKKMVNITLQGYDGNSHSLSSIKGKYILLDFWATWCGPCKQAIPEMKTIAQDYQKKLQIVSISVDDNKKDWENFLAKEGSNWLNLHDESEVFSNKYEVSGIPHYVLISPSPEYKVIDIWKGYSDGYITYKLSANMSLNNN